jgi:hypothetical protein
VTATELSVTVLAPAAPGRRVGPSLSVGIDHVLRETLQPRQFPFRIAVAIARDVRFPTASRHDTATRGAPFVSATLEVAARRFHGPV